ncbi:MAG: ParB family chromosome partitioning protein [Salibacteraceae bacterium]|jgi:ParB family chromosome partitioning protein
MAKKKALGRGLSALLSDAEMEAPSSLGVHSMSTGISEIRVSQIKPNENQPRTKFDEEALTDLADSIKQHGLVQPITIRKVNPSEYQIISGERRWRASQIAGLTSIPSYIRQVNDEQVLELALIENIQREDLDAMEIAISYQRMLDELKITQEVLAQKVSKNRSTVTNFLRLLNLPAQIQLAVKDGAISMGHARALLSAKSDELQLGIYKRILSAGLNVRQVEQLVKADKVAKKTTDSLKKAALSFEQQSNYLELQRIVRNKVDIKKDPAGKGKITINFKNNADLTRVLELLMP